MTYQNAIVAYAHMLEQYGIHPIIDDQAQARGNESPTDILPLPDKDHAPAFWTSVATMFKGDDAVLFNLKNEPHDGNWSCWHGGTCTGTDYNNNTYTSIGFQDLVTTVRNTGATNVIVLDGEGWANDLTQWLAAKPSDPQGNLMAGFHVYPFNGCGSQSCWNAQVLPVAQQVPLYFEEFNDTNSQNGGTPEDGTTFNRDVWTWADQHGIGYLMWTWNTTNDWQAIISNYNGTPTSYDGQAYHDHLASLLQAPTATPASTATATKVAATATATATKAAATATPRAATPTPSALSVRVTSASASPATVSRGGATTLAATINSNRALSNAIVDFEIYNAAGTKLYQTYRSPVSFAANSATTVKATWTVSTSLPTGGYTLKIGVFGPNWSPLYTWDNYAGTITVQ